MLQLKLDLSDPKLCISPERSPSLHLFYSWTCGIHEAEFFYQEDDEGIRILRYGKGLGTPDFPYASYPDSFPPQEVDLVPVSSDEENAVEKLNARDETSFDVRVAYPDLDVPRHQVGGRPRLMQFPPVVNCPVCASSMPLLATLGDEATSGLQFTRNPYVQTVYHLCRGCMVVGAYNLCD